MSQNARLRLYLGGLLCLCLFWMFFGITWLQLSGAYNVATDILGVHRLKTGIMETMVKAIGQKELDGSLEKELYANIDILVRRTLSNDEQSTLSDLKHSVAFATIATSGDTSIFNLREFVGSIHYHRSADAASPIVMVFAHGLTELELHELQLWTNVEIIDMEKYFFPVVAMENNRSLPIRYDWLRLLAIEFACRKYNSVIFVDPGYSFATKKGIMKAAKILQQRNYLLSYDADSMVDMMDVLRYNNGIHAFVYGAKEYDLFIRKGLRALRKFGHKQREHKDSDVANRLNSKRYVPLPIRMFDLIQTPAFNKTKRTGFYCYIDFREDIMYNFQLLPEPMIHSNSSNAKVPKYEDRKHIGIGIPCTSRRAKGVSDLSIIRHFLPSFLESITVEEYDTFTFTVYIGFDIGDNLFDQEDSFQEVRRTITDMVGSRIVDVQYIRFPPSNAWLTYIWNELYIRSIRDGNDYFYQVNDDLRIGSKGWATEFIRSLELNHGFGVAGPNDTRWSCELLTQAFVSRTHYDIFGFLYPVQIKDWYSDTYLTNLYGAYNATFCHEEMEVVNLRKGGSRYHICNKPKWRKALSRDREVIETWRDRNKTVRSLNGHHVK